MNQIDQLLEIVATYRKFGWTLRRLLLTPETAAALVACEPPRFADETVAESTNDAVWFSRPSHEQREAWELRLVSETAYALFETFESDETEEDRDERRQEMEAVMREHVTQG
jgi:hypothetical protein